jgi:hypothetical protein
VPVTKAGHRGASWPPGYGPDGVLRIGSERLLTVAHDPGYGIPCWDENALAEVRRYQQLSPGVGLLALAGAQREWARAAAAAPADAAVSHPESGTLTAVDVIRRNAHEVRHHVIDISRSGQDPPPGS